MKGAIVLTQSNVQFLAAVDEVRSDLGLELHHKDDHSLQLSDSGGRLLTAFSTAEPGSEWKDVLVASTCGGIRGDQMSGHPVECRWEDLFCLVVVELSARVEAWVVDGDGILWWGGSLEPGKLRL